MLRVRARIEDEDVPSAVKRFPALVERVGIATLGNSLAFDAAWVTFGFRFATLGTRIPATAASTEGTITGKFTAVLTPHSVATGCEEIFSAIRTAPCGVNPWACASSNTWIPNLSSHCVTPTLFAGIISCRQDVGKLASNVQGFP